MHYPIMFVLRLWGAATARHIYSTLIAHNANFRSHLKTFARRRYSDALSNHVCAELVVCAKAGYVSVAVGGGRGEGCESRTSHNRVTSHVERSKVCARPPVVK